MFSTAQRALRLALLVLFGLAYGAELLPSGRVHAPARAPRPPLPRSMLLTAAAASGGVHEAAVGQPDEPLETPRRRRSLTRALVAYLLWFFFGITGAHHLYLGRPREALACSVTCGGFAFGWAGDLFRLPKYLRELACAEEEAAGTPTLFSTGTTTDPRLSRDSLLEQGHTAAEAVGGAGASTALPTSAKVAAAAGGAATPALAARRLGILSALLRLLCRVTMQCVYGSWLYFHAARLLPDRLRARGAARRLSLFLPVVQTICAVLALYLRGATLQSFAELWDDRRPSATAAVASCAASTPAAAAATSPSVSTAFTAIPALHHSASSLASSTAASVRALLHHPVCRLVALVAIVAWQAQARSSMLAKDRLLPQHAQHAMLAAGLAAHLPGWRDADASPPLPAARLPRRTWRSALIAVSLATLFWTAVLVGSLLHTPVAVTLDGQSRTLSGWSLLSCALCAMRPRRLMHMIQCAPPPPPSAPPAPAARRASSSSTSAPTLSRSSHTRAHAHTRTHSHMHVRTQPRTQLPARVPHDRLPTSSPSPMHPRRSH